MPRPTSRRSNRPKKCRSSSLTSWRNRSGQQLEETNMPLHPQVRTILDQMATLGLPDLWSLSPQDARAQYAAARMPTPSEPVARVEDLTIPGPNGNIPARLYP